MFGIFHNKDICEQIQPPPQPPALVNLSAKPLRGADTTNHFLTPMEGGQHNPHPNPCGGGT